MPALLDVGYLLPAVDTSYGTVYIPYELPQRVREDLRFTLMECGKRPRFASGYGYPLRRRFRQRVRYAVEKYMRAVAARFNRRYGWLYAPPMLNLYVAYVGVYDAVV